MNSRRLRSAVGGRLHSPATRRWPCCVGDPHSWLARSVCTVAAPPGQVLESGVGGSWPTASLGWKVPWAPTRPRRSSSLGAVGAAALGLGRAIALEARCVAFVCVCGTRPHPRADCGAGAPRMAMWQPKPSDCRRSWSAAPALSLWSRASTIDCEGALSSAESAPKQYPRRRRPQRKCIGSDRPVLPWFRLGSVGFLANGCCVGLGLAGAITREGHMRALVAGTASRHGGLRLCVPCVRA